MQALVFRASVGHDCVLEPCALVNAGVLHVNHALAASYERRDRSATIPPPR
jgi:hypothetical protein